MKQKPNYEIDPDPSLSLGRNYNSTSQMPNSQKSPKIRQRIFILKP